MPNDFKNVPYILSGFIDFFETQPRQYCYKYAIFCDFVIDCRSRS